LGRLATGRFCAVHDWPVFQVSTEGENVMFGGADPQVANLVPVEHHHPSQSLLEADLVAQRGLHDQHIWS
jgi:hypothetical protein